MTRPTTLLLFLALATSLTACKREEAVLAPSAATAEAPAPAQAPATAPAEATKPVVTAAPAFQIETVAVTDKQLPPFPYLSMPSSLATGDFTNVESEFDAAHVIAGSQLRRVEGKISFRWFPLREAKLSPLAAYRNYDTAIKKLGATRVDTVQPNNEDFIARNGGDSDAIDRKVADEMLSQPDDAEIPGFQQYLIRTPQTNIWITMFFSNVNTRFGVRVIEEKGMDQVVSTVPAAELSDALKKKGHVTLYLNFDTDSHLIRQDSLPAIEEIAKLLQGQPALKLRVEGHTDMTGDAAHNRALSLARAQAVVQAIIAKQVSANRLSSAGKGPDQPLADNATEEGKAKNRRVELVRV